MPGPTHRREVPLFQGSPLGFFYLRARAEKWRETQPGGERERGGDDGSGATLPSVVATVAAATVAAATLRELAGG